MRWKYKQNSRNINCAIYTTNVYKTAKKKPLIFKALYIKLPKWDKHSILPNLFYKSINILGNNRNVLGPKIEPNFNNMFCDLVEKIWKDYR